MNLRIDDLQLQGLRLAQDPKQFCFGLDAVLLSDFAARAIRRGHTVLDLCAGNGIIPVLLTAKSAGRTLVGLEIQQAAAALAKYNVTLNSLEDKLTIIEGDLRNHREIFGNRKFDVITCNPPYKEAGSGLLNQTNAAAIARHELLCTLEDVISASAALLNDEGKLCMVHRPNRLVDILCLMRERRLEPKRLQYVHPTPEKPPAMLLIEAAKYGGKQLTHEPPIYVNEVPKCTTSTPT